MFHVYKVYRFIMYKDKMSHIKYYFISISFNINVCVCVYEKYAAQILLSPTSFLRNLIVKSLNSAHFRWG